MATRGSDGGYGRLRQVENTGQPTVESEIQTVSVSAKTARAAVRTTIERAPARLLLEELQRRNLACEETQFEPEPPAYPEQDLDPDDTDNFYETDLENLLQDDGEWEDGDTQPLRLDDVPEQSGEEDAESTRVDVIVQRIADTSDEFTLYSGLADLLLYLRDDGPLTVQIREHLKTRIQHLHRLSAYLVRTFPAFFAGRSQELTLLAPTKVSEELGIPANSLQNYLAAAKIRLIPGEPGQDNSRDVEIGATFFAGYTRDDPLAHEIMLNLVSGFLSEWQQAWSDAKLAQRVGLLAGIVEPETRQKRLATLRMARGRLGLKSQLDRARAYTVLKQKVQRHAEVDPADLFAAIFTLDSAGHKQRTGPDRSKVIAKLRLTLTPLAAKYTLAREWLKVLED